MEQHFSYRDLLNTILKQLEDFKKDLQNISNISSNDISSVIDDCYKTIKETCYYDSIILPSYLESLSKNLNSKLDSKHNIYDKANDIFDNLSFLLSFSTQSQSLDTLQSRVNLYRQLFLIYKNVQETEKILYEVINYKEEIIKNKEEIIKNYAKVIKDTEEVKANVKDLQNIIDDTANNIFYSKMSEGFTNAKREINKRYKLQNWILVGLCTVIMVYSVFNIFILSSINSIDIIKIIIHEIVIFPLLIVIWVILRDRAYTLQLREEYDYKIASIASFQGYKNEISGRFTEHDKRAIQANHELYSYLLKITIDNLADNPAKVFQREQKVTPIENLVEALNTNNLLKALNDKNLNKQ